MAKHLSAVFVFVVALTLTSFLQQHQHSEVQASSSSFNSSVDNDHANGHGHSSSSSSLEEVEVQDDDDDDKNSSRSKSVSVQQAGSVVIPPYDASNVTNLDFDLETAVAVEEIVGTYLFPKTEPEDAGEKTRVSIQIRDTIGEGLPAAEQTAALRRLLVDHSNSTTSRSKSSSSRRISAAKTAEMLREFDAKFPRPLRHWTANMHK